MASANACTNSFRKIERAAWSSFILPFPARRCRPAAAPSCLPADLVREPIADAAADQKVEREQPVPHQADLVLEALRVARLARPRPQPPLDEARQRAVHRRGHDRA